MAMGTSWAADSWAEGAWADGTWADLGSGQQGQRPRASQYRFSYQLTDVVRAILAFFGV